jgi:hypothetical protein
MVSHHRANLAIVHTSKKKKNRNSANVWACGLDSNEFLHQFQGEFQTAQKYVPKKLTYETQDRNSV